MPQAAGIADGAFYNTGQSCCSVERVYVNEKIFKPFVDAFVAGHPERAQQVIIRDRRWRFWA